ncbi:MAG: hypothetical protein IJ149_03220 [Oscillospiraceae bacterium]|nr:hypothetical protein [Oscillospiraceae bacterium]
MKYYLVNNKNDTAVIQKRLGKHLVSEPADAAVTPLFQLLKTDVGLHKDKTAELTSEKLSDYTNLSGGKWETGCIYAEHPYIENGLVLRKEYNSYIQRDIIADISDYIMDNTSVAALTVGIVYSSDMGGNARIPVENVDIEASIKVAFSKGLYVHFENSSPPLGKKEHVWINRFPDIKSAVEHHAAHFESIQNISLELDMGINIAEAVNGGLFGKKNRQIYVRYTA